MTKHRPCLRQQIGETRGLGSSPVLQTVAWKKAPPQAGPRLRVARSLWVVFLILGLQACAWQISSDEHETFLARAKNRAIVLENNTADQVYFFVLGRRASALVDWVPMLDSRGALGKGESRLIPYEEIDRHRDGEEEVLVYWWTAIEVQGVRRPGKVQQMVVAL
jgi:hypothetical protein